MAIIPPQQTMTMFEADAAVALDGFGALSEPANAAPVDPWISDVDALTLEDVTGLMTDADAELAEEWDELLDTLDRLLESCEDALATTADADERFYFCDELLRDR